MSTTKIIQRNACTRRLRHRVKRSTSFVLGFFEWFHATLTVTAFREPSTVVSRACCHKPPPSYQARTASKRITRDAPPLLDLRSAWQISRLCWVHNSCPRPTSDASEMMVNVWTSSSASDGEDEESGEESFYRWNVERLESFLTGLQLRLGYWPTTSFNDPSARHIDWQGCFERSSSDKLGFATFVHCLLDGGAEYAWLSPNDDTPGE